MNQQTALMRPSIRMLLAGDGSTTVLLEALTGSRLSVRVDAQGENTSDHLSAQIRAALELPAGARVLERRSCLVTPAQEVVSINLVVLDEMARHRVGEPDTLVPIGCQLRDRRISQHREHISSGVAPWPGGGAQAVDSAYKEYVIHYANGGRVYVHEHFSPQLVPLFESDFGPIPSNA